ncbi:MAG: bifunctional DNA-formamidopyrimidine glycosylase/DNA-(apurinic or apyrimidinic site) lyase [Hyphomicrobiaceae bacterium]|nr:bifunctional DNA-formamidopyrimidine glycosylase/DNA-(apurinic or apyrimidinic site) lyase [Hyphomicrobiaceae bacterium]
MPELPEVETVRRGLEPVLVGQRLVRVEQRRPNLRFPLPPRFVERLTGQRIEALERRAKYILARLSAGEVLLVHLGMTGRFAISAAEGAAPEQPGAFVHEAGGQAVHDHVVLQTEAGAVVTYNDVRRFGFMLLARQDELDQHPLLNGLGPEPLSDAFDARYIASVAQGRAVDLKAFLMDQRVVAGLGNIYVSEALHRARLSPLRKAATLASARGKPTARAARLEEAIREVLADAIAAGGSTLRDYKRTDGSLGYFQHNFRVYGRDGERCGRGACRGVIEKRVQAARSTYFCRLCQR